METKAHLSLKRFAMAFILEHGGRAVAAEVQCPLSRYRVDVAGYADGASPERSPGRTAPRPPARTIVIECKQSRPDFIRDRRDQSALLRARRSLEELRAAMERRMRQESPHLCAGEALFPELDAWDFTAAERPAYRQLLRRVRRLEKMIHGETKLCMMARYALADRLYIAAPRGMVRPRELPRGWGLLECSARALGDSDPNRDLFGRSRLEVRVNAPRLPTKPDRRQRLLRNIAVSASGSAARSAGILPPGRSDRSRAPIRKGAL